MGGGGYVLASQRWRGGSTFFCLGVWNGLTCFFGEYVRSCRRLVDWCFGQLVSIHIGLDAVCRCGVGGASGGLFAPRGVCVLGGAADFSCCGDGVRWDWWGDVLARPGFGVDVVLCMLRCVWYYVCDRRRTCAGWALSASLWTVVASEKRRQRTRTRRGCCEGARDSVSVVSLLRCSWCSGCGRGSQLLRRGGGRPGCVAKHVVVVTLLRSYALFPLSVTVVSLEER